MQSKENERVSLNKLPYRSEPEFPHMRNRAKGPLVN